MQLLLLLQLRVAVDQQRRVLAVRQALLVQRLQVLCQLRHALRVQELADHIRGFHESDGVHIPTSHAHTAPALLDSLFVLVLVIQVVAISTPHARTAESQAVDVEEAVVVHTAALRDVQRHRVLVLLVE